MIFVGALKASPRLRIASVPDELKAEAIRWLPRHDEREYSFVDAISFALMRSLRSGTPSPSTATSRPRGSGGCEPEACRATSTAWGSGRRCLIERWANRTLVEGRAISLG